MTLRNAKFALNPLQFIATGDGWLDPALAPPLRDRLREISMAGFTSIQTDVPGDLTPAQYHNLLSEYGIQPGPGYISLNWHEDAAERQTRRSAYRRTAAANVEAGEPLVFVSLGMSPDAPRVARPAIGHDADADRLDLITEWIAAVSADITAEGGVAALHPHVGAWVETPDEARHVLDHVDSSILRFGPDVGHLAWQGADPAEIMSEYADRIAGVHIKDIHAETARRSRKEGLSYRETIGLGLWTEPGKGDIDIERLLNVLPDTFEGWVVIEVDATDLPARESIQDCASWLAGYQQGRRILNG